MYKELFAANDTFMNHYTAVKPFIKGLMIQGKQAGLDPEDLESELMLKVYTISQVFDESRGVKFATYAISCLRNQYNEIISQKRAQKRSNGKMDYSLDYKIDPEQESCPLQDILAAKVDDPFEAYWQKECNAAIEDFFNSFGTEEERGMIHLHFQGVKQSIIAEKYGCGQSLVSYNISKFKRRLKAFLIQEGYIEA